MKSDIRKVSILIHKSCYNDLLCKLGKSELLHLCKGDQDTYSEMSIDEELQRENEVGNLLHSVESLYEESGISLPDMDIDKLGNLIMTQSPDGDLTRDSKYLRLVRKKLEQYEKLRGLILIKKEETEEINDELTTIQQLLSGNTITAAMNLCAPIFGSVESEINDEKLYITPMFLIKQYGGYIYGISMEDSRKEMVHFLNSFGFVDKTSLLSSSDLLNKEIEKYRRRIQICNARLTRIENAISFMKKEWKEVMDSIYNRYFALAKTYDARRNFLFSSETVLINGWMDIENLDRLESLIKLTTFESYYLSVSSKSETKKYKDKIPVILKNFRFFKPFELLVKNMGLPENRELDPTPFTAITYIIMFGVMFGDVGQGLVLALAGFILRLVARKKKIKDGFLPNGGGILIYCGLSAAVFGLLYGSFFSNEHLIPALWFHPMEHMMELFFATIMMGAVFITIGLIFSIINGFFYGHIDESLFGTKGFMGLIAYGGIIVIFFRLIQFQAQPEMWMLIAFLAVPVAVFSLRNFLAFLFLGAEKIFPHGAFEYIVETIVEIIEMFSGFLGNTISFIRAGAFALSHAGLSIAIFTLAHIISPDGYSIGSIITLIIGNIFIILLEGLVCGIQSMRLEYYEFFGKFFHGNGMDFKPYSLQKQIYGKGGV